MHRDHPGAVRSERGTQAVRASAEEAARELEERRKNAVDKKFMYEKEEKKKLEKRIAMMLLYPYVYDNIYCCVLEVVFVNYFTIDRDE